MTSAHKKAGKQHAKRAREKAAKPSQANAMLSDATGRIGVYQAGSAFTRLGWFFREQPISDSGIDAQAEAPDQFGRPSGKLLALQIKAGSSRLRERVDRGFVYRGTLRHLQYWQQHSLPVVVLLVDPSSGRVWWQVVTFHHVEPTLKGWKIVVPFAQSLDESSLAALADLCGNVPVEVTPEKNHAIVRLLAYSKIYSRGTLAKIGRKYRGDLYTSRAPDREIWTAMLGDPARHSKALVLRERAGSGKTNLMCHLAERIVVANYPCIFILGSEPLSERTGLVTEMLRGLGIDVETPDRLAPALAELGEILAQADSTPLYILIDAINEAREVEQMRSALLELMAAVKPLPVRLLITCRDIYWDFLKGDWIDVLDATVRSFDMYHYDESAWPVARARYFQAFDIRGEFADEADLTCRHPLLLRFFCEAYGGEDVGVVKQIRLKPLFEKYLVKKVERLVDARKLLRAEESATRILQSIAAAMLDKRDSSLSELKVAGLTGEHQQHLARDSMYVKLLDEDIILDEIPDTRRHTLERRVRFVYEAFFEFMLARELAGRWETLSDDEVMEQVVALLDPSSGMRNAQGALAFLDEFFESRRLSVWRLLAERSAQWQRLVLATMRETDPAQRSLLLLEAFPTLLNSTSYETRISALELLLNPSFRAQFDRNCELAARVLREDPRREVRHAALGVLVAASYEDTPETAPYPPGYSLHLAHACLDPAKGIRRRAIQTLAEMSSDRRPFLDLLTKALQSSQARVRSYAAIALDLNWFPTARRKLLRCLDDPDPWVRRAALIRLRDFPRKQDVRLISDRLADEHPAVRSLAARTCTAWTMSEFRPTLSKRIEVEQSGVVLARLIEALIATGFAGAQDQLRQLLVHPYYWVRAHAGHALFALDGSAAVKNLMNSVRQRLKGRWLAYWPKIKSFGGPCGIENTSLGGFASDDLDVETAAFVCGVFGKRVIGKSPALSHWLTHELPKMSPPLIEAYLQGIKAGDGGALFMDVPQRRELLRRFLLSGSEITRGNVAFMLGSLAPSMDRVEIDSILKGDSERVRQAFVWGIEQSSLAWVGSRLGIDAREKARPPPIRILKPNMTVPTWNEIAKLGYITEAQRASLGMDDDIPF